MVGRRLLEENGVPGAIHRASRNCGWVYQEYQPARGKSARLRALPSTQVYLDVSFGGPPRLNDMNVALTGTVYGMRTGPVVLTRSEGWGILVELSPHEAYTMLDVPLSELTNRVTDVVEVLGRKAGQFVDRLAEASGRWERLALLHDELAELAQPARSQRHRWCGRGSSCAGPAAAFPLPSWQPRSVGRAGIC